MPTKPSLEVTFARDYPRRRLPNGSYSEPRTEFVTKKFDTIVEARRFVETENAKPDAKYLLRIVSH